MRALRRILPLVALLVVAALTSPLHAQSTDKAKPATAVNSGRYIGAEECRGCHAGIYKNFAQTQHWKTTEPLPAAHDGRGCESCHGPGRDHADSLGDPTKIIRFNKLSKKEVAERCLTCHQYTEEHGNFRRSAHRNSDVTCLDCHSVHHAEQSRYLLRMSQPDLCYGCHAAQRAEFSQPFHHRVDEKLITCTECHNQHGTLLGRQLRSAASQASICGKCHADTVGPFTFEHPPQKTDGCITCHSPHGSANPRMLRVSQVNLLCLSCHSGLGKSTSLVTPSFHNQDQQFQSCNLCHAAIHGSNVDRRFRR